MGGKYQPARVSGKQVLGEIYVSCLHVLLNCYGIRESGRADLCRSVH